MREREGKNTRDIEIKALGIELGEPEHAVAIAHDLAVREGIAQEIGDLVAALTITPFGSMASQPLALASTFP